jgi:hypothetical protein
MTDYKDIDVQFLWSLCGLLDKKPEIFDLVSVDVSGIKKIFDPLSLDAFALDVARMMILESGITGVLVQMKLARISPKEKTGSRSSTDNWKKILQACVPTNSSFGRVQEKDDFIFLIPTFYGLDASGDHNMLGLINASKPRRELAAFLQTNGIEINELITYYKSTVGDINPEHMKSYPIFELIGEIGRGGTWLNEKFCLYKRLNQLNRKNKNIEKIVSRLVIMLAGIVFIGLVAIIGTETNFLTIIISIAILIGILSADDYLADFLLKESRDDFKELERLFFFIERKRSA